MYEGAIYADLEEVRSEVIALADLLEHLPAGQRRMKNETEALFLTPEQEKALEEEHIKYAAEDREELGLLVNKIQNLISILGIYALDNPNEFTDDQILTMLQTLGFLIEPVQEYFADTAGFSFEGEA
jgi:TorA maturation chaperone TorD